jgi:hypothetical protein
MTAPTKVIFQKDYHGFEDAVDIERDVSECFDARFNPAMEGIPGEFQGTIRVTVEYIPEEE